MGIPSFPSDLLEISIERERESSSGSGYCTCCVWKHRVCVERELRLPLGGPSFWMVEGLSLSCNQTPENHSLCERVLHHKTLREGLALGAHPVRTDVQVLVSEHKVLGLSVITSKSLSKNKIGKNMTLDRSNCVIIQFWSEIWYFNKTQTKETVGGKTWCSWGLRQKNTQALICSAVRFSPRLSVLKCYSFFFKVITFLVLVHRADQAMGAYPLIVELCDFCDTENMDGNTESSHKKWNWLYNAECWMINKSKVGLYN